MRWFFRSIGRSFYDLSFYHEVAARWNGWGLGLIAGVFAMLSVIGVVLGVFALHFVVVKDNANGEPGPMRRAMEEIAVQWPQMKIENNTATVTGHQPVVISVSVKNKPTQRFEIMTIDTTGTTTADQMKTPILMTSHQIYVKNDKKTELYDLSQFTKDTKGTLLLDAKKMQAYMQQAADAMQKSAWIFYIVFGFFTAVFIVCFLMFLRLCLLLPLALAGLIAAKILKDPMNYSACMRLISVALVPVTLIGVFSLFVFQSGVSILIEIVVGIGIVVLVASTRTTSTQ